MSVNWSWKAKKGCIVWQPNKNLKKKENGKVEYLVPKPFKWNFYQANCLGCFLYEYKDNETGKDMYKFETFFNDYEHLKKCLGLKKCYDGMRENLFNGWYVTHHIKEIRLNTYYKDNLKIADCFTKAKFKHKIKVTLYYKEIK